MQIVRKIVILLALAGGILYPTASVFASNFHLILGADYVNSDIKYNNGQEDSIQPTDDYNSISPVIGLSAYGIGLEAYILNSKDVKEGSLQYKLRAYGFDIVGEASLSDNFALIASLGMAKYEFHNKIDGTKADDSNNGPRFGIGLQYYICRNIAIRAMYHYTLLNSGEKDPYDAVSEFSAGLRFIF